MKTKLLLSVIFLLTLVKENYCQTYPTFGTEIPVTISGLTFDAMEPSISADGNYIFFNSLNDGITTSLYYATKVNDSTFTYTGALTGANQTITPRLDAVASSDSVNKFFWTSLRDFPTQFDNCFHGTFNGTDVVSIGRLHGTFYIYSAGWLMMDAAINYNGNLLYYTNGYFGPTYAGCGGIPCQAKLGVAQKLNDSTFNKLSNSDGIMQNINDTNYVVYAPNVSKNGLELYYTRVLKSNVSLGTQICVSVRTNLVDTFSLPSIFYPFSTLTPEATTLSSDQSKIYYHKKSGGLYKLFLRYRTSTTGINETENIDGITIYPNPFTTQTTLQTNNLLHNATLTVNNCLGQTVKQIKNISGQTVSLSRDNLPSGLYYLRLTQDNRVITVDKLVITD